MSNTEEVAAKYGRKLKYELSTEAATMKTVGCRLLVGRGIGKYSWALIFYPFLVVQPFIYSADKHKQKGTSILDLD